MKINDISKQIEKENIQHNDKSIIKSHDPFTDDWIDPEIIGRDNFLMKITNYVSLYKSGIPFHVILNGKEGIGKSFLLKSIFHSIKNADISGKFPYLYYMKCSDIRPSNYINDIKKKLKLNNKIKNIADLYKYVNGNGIMIVFDDLDFVKRLDIFIEKIIIPIHSMNISTIYLTQQKDVIFNKLKRMDNRITYKMIYLNAYSENDLITILQHRASEGLSKSYQDILDSLSLRYIAQKSNEISISNCRLAIKIMYESIINAIDKNTKVTIPIINHVINENKNYHLDHIRNRFKWDIHLKALFKSIASISNIMPQKKIYEIYKLNLPNNVSPRSYMWINNKLHDANKCGIIFLNKIGGKGKIMNTIKIAIDQNILYNYIQNIEV